MSDQRDAGTKGPSRQVLIWAAVWAFILGLLLFSVMVLLLVQVWNRDAIHHAVERGDVEKVKSLLDADPSRLEQRNRLQLTPLLEAAWRNQPDVLSELVRRGADVNAKWDLASTGDGGWNALHITAIRGGVETAGVLIRAGTEINAKTLKGETPLDVAVRSDHKALVALLQSNGAVSAKAR